ncbi:amidohydrolase family protein [Iamia sp. SCSIO 61187]|uniref:amidohydrolase family protein n=1 Tax=Iamia sp. SCSIO 61187 TaxID=2722752 RepID=UPI001C63A462|nr:amidohydrolase family protein [Iamia sp. SCSIO 61187]QYG93140.1 amidohydrolase family protein [Iamia sp. SCSIO 61187]
MATLVLQGGRVIDPAAEIDATTDVVVADGTIVSVGPADPALLDDPATEVRDCRGLLVVPGLIDLHVHVMAGLGDFCVEPDRVGVGMGVPTIVDGGTSGVATFDISRRAIIDHPDTRSNVLAFLDPNQLYLATKDFICHKLEIAGDLRNLDTESLAASIERNADVVVGAKVRACHVGDPGHSPFLAAAQEAMGPRPVMVHLGRFPFTPVITPIALLDQLRGGDIITHAFRGAGGMRGPDGKAVPQLRDAVDRGVVLDIGHSGTDFRFREARLLMEEGYLPDTASTDINVFTVDGPVFSLAETLTKMLALDLDLHHVIAMGTSNSARAIGRSHELGRLEPGRSAEVSILRLREDGPFPVSDGVETVESPRALEPVACLRAGAWHDVPRLPSFATEGGDWSDMPDDIDW